jgi:hypothetical protein
MFSVSGHIFFLICVALGLLQIQPERSIPRKVPVVQVRLTAATSLPRSLTSLPKQLPETAAASTLTTTATPAPAATPQPDTLPNPPALPANDTSPAIATSAIPIASELAPNAAAPIDIPYYYSLKQLTEKPRVIEDATTNMTLILPGVENQNLILRLLINEQGGVDQVEIEQSTLDKDVSAVVTGGFGKLRFLPGKIDGVAVKCQLRIEVSLENADKPPLQRQPIQN